MHVQLTFHKSTHAPLYERYMPSGEFEEVGEEGQYGPVDPETGAELKALGGKDHRYNRDYKVGSSYPKCGFFSGRHGEESLTHDELEAVLRHHGLWADCLHKVMWPHMLKHGEALWMYGFQFKPVDRTPRTRRMEERFERVAANPDYTLGSPYIVETGVKVPDDLFEDDPTALEADD